MNNKSFEIKVSKAVFGGDSIAKLPDNKTVFIPFALPDELVNIELLEEKKRFAKAYLKEVIEPSALRIDPACPHYAICGGCHYQHLSYQDQLNFKETVFKEQLQRIAGISTDIVRPIEASPKIHHYRNRIQFHVSPDGECGFQSAYGNDFVPVDTCYLAAEPILETWKKIEFGEIQGLSRMEFLVGDNDDILLTLESDDEKLPQLELNLPISVVHHSPFGEIVVAGNNYTNISVLDRKFSVSAGSFFQINTEVAAMIVQWIMDQAAITKDTTIIDLYCGAGLFSAFFAPEAGNVIGIESHPAACQDYAFNLDAYDNVSLYEGMAEDILPGIEIKADIVLVDPPRAGLHGKVLDEVVSLNPQQIIYVSCDPATLARDLKRFAEKGYSVQSIKPFDMFPQTYHIETVVFLSNGNS